MDNWWQETGRKKNNLIFFSPLCMQVNVCCDVVVHHEIPTFCAPSSSTIFHYYLFSMALFDLYLGSFQPGNLCICPKQERGKKNTTPYAWTTQTERTSERWRVCFSYGRENWRSRERNSPVRAPFSLEGLTFVGKEMGADERGYREVLVVG